ncbi:MAG TPA: TonB-dependent receptor, partial [Gemmatimonadaceae bacterium]
MPGIVHAQARDSVARRDSLVHRDSLAKRDTAPRSDSLIKRDSTDKADTVPLVPLPTPKVPRDTIKAPLAHAEQPFVADPTGSYHLDHDQIFASGARSVGDLLERLPGITQLRTGWFATPATAAYLGDATAVRVFLDGVEYLSLDPHSGGALDYTQIPLWPIEAITIERSASEVRVYLNSWRVDRTTPYTRTDISTGDEQTNLYRGFFGRRFKHGESLQFGVQQYGTDPSRGGATSDQLSLMGRLGWARGKFSFDAFMMQVGSHRGLVIDPLSGDSLPDLESTRRDAYVRLGYGDPDGGPWLQVVAATARYSYAGQGATATTTDSTAQGDTVVSYTQYLFTGGLTKWGVRVSGAARYFSSFDRADRLLSAPGDTLQSPAAGGPYKAPQITRTHGLLVPSARASYDWRRLSLSAYGEGQSVDSVARQEVSAALTPFSFLRFSAAMGSAHDLRISDSLLSPTYRRLEAGLRIHDVWLGGGTIMRGASMLAAPTLVDDSLRGAREQSATAQFVSVQGRVWRGINADAFALRWSDSTGLYRPQYQTHSQLYISTSLLNRFPNNTFHIFFGLTHEYRSATYFPLGDAGIERLPGYR